MKAYLVFLLLCGLLVVVRVVTLIKLNRKNLSRSQLDKRISWFHWVILGLGILMAFQVLLFDVNVLRYDAPIPYERKDEITLQDFKGLNKPGNTLDGGTEFAFIEVDWKVRQGNGWILVENRFHPARSYVYLDNLYSPDLLQHELVHFQISELYARKFRRELTMEGEQLSNKELKRRLLRYRLLEREEQARYDDETYHGYVLNQQKAWEHRLDSLLQTHAAYEETLIDYSITYHSQ